MKIYFRELLFSCLMLFFFTGSMSQPCHDNLIVNGDFSQGNGIGFNSGLNYLMFCQPGTYGVANEPKTKCSNPNWVNDLWDHTKGDNTGRQLIIDSDASDAVIWENTNTINVTVGQTYEFSFWHHRGISIVDEQTLEMRINGNLMNTISTANSPADRWVQYSTTWTPGSGSTVNNVSLEIMQVNSHLSNNDHSLDDIFFGQSPPIGITYQIQNTSCGQTNNGGIDVTLTGGFTPFSFSWSKNGDPSFSASTEDISNIGTGTYTLTVTDANSCTRTESFTVNSDPNIVASAVVTDARCDIPNTGSIDLSVSGGAPGYTFSWIEIGSSFTATTEDIQNVPVGNYQVTVTDQNNCSQVFNYAITTSAITVVYVDQYATGMQTGQSWTDAFTELQSAMELVRRGCANEIWVSQGEYNPAQDPISAYVGGITHLQGLSPNEYFYEMIPSVGIYGGFDASTSPQPNNLNQRDWKNNPTVLNGIMSLPSGVNVHTISLIRNINVGIGPDATLDGFTLKNINSTNNAGVSHGGMGSQGAICQISDSPTITNCIFENNQGDFGSCINSVGSSSIITYCIFRNNEAIAATAAGVYLSHCSTEIVNCLFHDNISVGSGAAMILVTSQGDFIVNCTFTQNESITGKGGAVGTSYSQQATFSNCIFWDNVCQNPSFWSIYSYPAHNVPEIRYSNVQNTEAADPATGISYGWDNKATANPYFTEDERPEFINPGNNDFRLSDITPLRARGLNSDIAGYPTDLAGNTRILPVSQGIVDMGCYENTTMPYRRKDPNAKIEVNEEQSATYTIYPNPSSGMVFLSGPIESIRQLTIMDVSGKIILERNSVVNQELDLSELENGLYLMQIINESGQSNIQRIVKQ